MSGWRGVETLKHAVILSYSYHYQPPEARPVDKATAELKPHRARMDFNMAMSGCDSNTLAPARTTSGYERFKMIKWRAGSI